MRFERKFFVPKLIGGRAPSLFSAAGRHLRAFPFWGVRSFQKVSFLRRTVRPGVVLTIDDVAWVLLLGLSFVRFFFSFF